MGDLVDGARKTDSGANSLVSNSTPLLAELVRQGHGVAILPSYAPLVNERLVPLSLGVEFLTPFWMSFRRENADQPHVRAMTDMLRRAIDRKRMPWFADTFIYPTPELLEGWRAMVHAETAAIADHVVPAEAPPP